MDQPTKELSWRWWVVVAVQVLAVAAIVAWIRNTGRGVLDDEPVQLTLYSIDGPFWHLTSEGPLTPEQWKGELLLGFPVLGKVEVSDARQRQRIADAVNRSIEIASGGAACFYPRHAIRTVKNGNDLVLVICFQCNNFNQYEAGNQIGSSRLISADGESVLDEVLTNAGVALAAKNFP